MEKTKSAETLQLINDFRAQLAHDNVETEEYHGYFEKLQYIVNYIGSLERKVRALNEKNEDAEKLNEQIKELMEDKARLKMRNTVLTTERDSFISRISSLEFEQEEAFRQLQLAKQEVCDAEDQLKKAQQDLRDEENNHFYIRHEFDELRKGIDEEAEEWQASIAQLHKTVDTLRSRLLKKDDDLNTAKARIEKAEKEIAVLKSSQKQHFCIEG